MINLCASPLSKSILMSMPEARVPTKTCASIAGRRYCFFWHPKESLVLGKYLISRYLANSSSLIFPFFFNRYSCALMLRLSLIPLFLIQLYLYRDCQKWKRKTIYCSLSITYGEKQLPFGRREGRVAYTWLICLVFTPD